jgi:hypothetical protein
MTRLPPDIQSSTEMWETLPEQISDQAVGLHADIIRTLMKLHNGYECGTEVRMCVCVWVCRCGLVGGC